MFKRVFLLSLMLLLLVGCGADEALDEEPALSGGNVPAADVEVAEPEADAPVDTAVLTPVEVTDAFYGWYLESVGEPATGSGTNVLAERLYADSPYLTDSFVAHIDEILASFDQGGYDPILLAQNIPVSVECTDAIVGDGEATVVVHEEWGGSATDISVLLVKEDGRWKIDNVRRGNPLTAAGATTLFYEWYLSYAETANPLVDRAYARSPYVTESFVGRVDELLAGMEQGGYDPLLCAQDIPQGVGVDQVFFPRNEMYELTGQAQVLVRTSFEGHAFTVTLYVGDDGVWQIGDVTCTGEPAGVAKAFYTFYLGYARDPESGEMRNPMVDGVYRQSGFLSEDLVEEMSVLMEGEMGLHADPFLLAQDLPRAFTVDPGLTSETAIVHLMHGSETVRHLQLTFVQVDGRWLIDAVAEAPVPEVAAPVATTEMAVYASDLYGFSFNYPQEWVVQELETLAGGPADWPVVQTLQVMPAGVAATMGGPPDPTAPVIVAPIQVEVVEGDEAALARAYVAAESAEEVVISGLNVRVERDGSGVVRYLFQDPVHAERWLVISDLVGEFPGREEQAQSAAGVVEQLLASVAFGG